MDLEHAGLGLGHREDKTRLLLQALGRNGSAPLGPGLVAGGVPEPTDQGLLQLALFDPRGFGKRRAEKKIFEATGG